MKTKLISAIHALRHSCRATIYAGAFLVIATSASAQNLFVSDYSANIYEISSGGGLSTFATGMDYPFGLAFNSLGDLFVANSANNSSGGSIIKITPEGVQTTFATGIDTVSVVVDKAGNVYAADYRSGVVYKYTPDGVPSTFATGFANPISLIFDHAGDLFVGAGYGEGNGYITKITPAGEQSVFASGLSFPDGLAFNRNGDLFVSSQISGVIYEYTPDGVQSTFAIVSASGLNAMVFDKKGDLFAAAGGQILKITPRGKASTFATIPTGTSAGLALQPGVHHHWWKP